MSILFVTPDIMPYRGGIQRYSHDLLDSLKSSDDEILVLLKNTQSRELENLEASHIQYYTISQIPYVKNVLFTILFLYLVCFKKPKKLLVGHIHFLPLIYFSQFVFTIPYIVFVYGVEAWNYKGKIIKKTLSLAEKIVSISEFTKKKLFEAYDLDSKTIEIIPCTADSNRFYHPNKNVQLRNQYTIPENAPVILTVSRLEKLEPFHSYDTIIDIFPRLCLKYPDLHYFIVGAGSDFDRVQDRIEEQSNIHLTGFVSEEDLPLYYSFADAFVMPGKLEGFGIVYLEALFCGVPVVVSTEDGSFEVLVDKRIGRAVPPENEKQIIEAISDILDKREQKSPDVIRQIALSKFGKNIFHQKALALLGE